MSKTKGKVVGWLESAKKNLLLYDYTTLSNKHVGRAKAEALVSIAESLEELVGLVRESQETETKR